MQLLIQQIKSLNQEVLKENTHLASLLQKQIRYNRNLERKKTLSKNNDVKNISIHKQLDQQNIVPKRQNGFIRQLARSKLSTTKEQSFLKHKKDAFKSNNKNSSFCNNSSHFNRQQKRSNRCPSCKSLNKSRKSTSNQTAITHSKIINTKHQSNMMKLQKLSQKILPKVSKNWLYKKKAKVFHFQ